jgi:membrane protease YdiL (CAAX protease family)
VPAEFWTDAARMATAGGLVAAGTVPVALLALALRPREPLLPRWSPWRVPWNGFEVVVTVLVVQFLITPLVYNALTGSGFFNELYGPDSDDPGARDVAQTVRKLWASVLSLPLQLGALAFALRQRYPAWEPQVIGRGSPAGKVALGAGAALVLTPLVLVLNAGVNYVSQQQGVEPESHALARLSGRPALDQALLVIEACVGAPLREELLIRGLLLAWCVGRVPVPGAGVGPVTAARPWFVMCAAALLAFTSEKTGAMVFAAALAVGLAVLWRVKRTGARRCRAVYATAALFGLMHSSVWPNPVALFVLGLGLGWLAVRTNGVLVPVLVHALFNAVSALFVLRG